MVDATNRNPTREHLVLFFGVTFAFSWLLWLLPVLRSNGIPELPEAVGLLGILAPFGPSVAAFWLVWRSGGRPAVGNLWLRGWRVGFDRKWLIPALGLMPVVALVNVILVLVLGGEIDWGVGVTPLMVLPVLVLIYIGNALPEEYGWRGHALDPLQRRFKPLGASLVLGLIWGLWHLPLVFIDGTTQSAIPYHEFVLQTIVLASIYTWLHNSTGGSVLIAALFHASSNITGAAIPTWTTELGRWVNFALLLVVAGAVTWRAARQHVTETPAAS